MKISAKNVKKLKSKLWRLEHLYKIKDKNSKIITFKLNEAQWQFVNERGSHRYVYVLKSRQMGMTTFRCIELLDKAMWIKGSSCAIIAHRQEDVLKIFEIVKRAYENVPDALKPKARYDSKNELVFDHDFTGRKLDSKIYVAMKLRSGTVSDLHISESAYIKDRQELKAGSKQAVGKSGSITEETTANGFNEFQEEYQRAIEDWGRDTGIPQEQKYKPLFFAWHEFREYKLKAPRTFKMTDEEKKLAKKYKLNKNQLSWRRWKIQELGSQKDSERKGLTGLQLFKQEYPASIDEAFQASGRLVVSADTIEAMEVKKPIMYKYGVSILTKPKKDHRYVVGADPANGTGNDSTGIEVLDIDTLEEVAFFNDNTISPTQAGVKAVKLATWYNEALLIPEKNRIAMLLKIEELSYQNIYIRETLDKITKKKKNEHGWTTTGANRDLLIDDLVEAIENGEIGIYSAILISQLRTFVRKDNGRREHEDGRHDDNIIALGLALQGKKSYQELVFDFV